MGFPENQKPRWSFQSEPSMVPYINRIRRENRLEEEHICRLHALAYAEAQRIAREMGKADPGLKKVILFGSTLPGREFRSNSDIDLAVIGGNRARLENVAASSSFSVDLLELNDARSAIIAGIEKEGVVLYATPEN